MWKQAEHNGELARQCLVHSRDYLRGWLATADPTSAVLAATSGSGQ